MKWPIYFIRSTDGNRYLGVDEEWHDMKLQGLSTEALEFWENEKETAEQYAKEHKGVVARNTNP